MITFDPNNYDAVGIVQEQNINSNNALIQVIGIVERANGQFFTILPEDRRKVFPSRGCVFAYDFFKHHYTWKGECICLAVKPNNNPNIVNGEEYVWDWSVKEYIFADRLRTLEKALGENGEENYKILSDNDVFDGDEDHYVISSGNVYKVSSGSRLAPFWKLSSLSDYLVELDGVFFLYKDIDKPENGKIDLTTDEQLLEWYKKNILRKEWSKIYEAKDFKAVEDITTETLKKVNIPQNVFQSRLTRITTMSGNISLTFEELEDLGSSPWFQDTVVNTMNRFSDLYIERVKAKNAKELKDLAEELVLGLEAEKEKFALEKSKLDDILAQRNEDIKNIDSRIAEKEKTKRGEIDALESKISSLNETIKEKEDFIARLGERKESIVADFEVIREVLGTSCAKQNGVPGSSCHIEEINYGSDQEFPVLQPYKKNLESFLMKFRANKVSVNGITSAITGNKIILLPDNATIKAVLHATGHCRYAMEYVGVDWKSFSDLWDNGLGAIVESCFKDKGTLHFLILKNINFSFIPSYLQPVLDIAGGMSETFPGTVLSFPDNLRILCTRHETEMIPVSESSLEGIMCVGRGEILSEAEKIERAENLNPEKAFVTGFVPASLWESSESNTSYSENAVEDYIDAE